MGNVASMQLGGFLMRYTGTWTSVFYAFGIFGLLWLLFWFALIYNHPNRHPFIGAEEKSYLNHVINTVDSEDVSIRELARPRDPTTFSSLSFCFPPGQTVDPVERNLDVGTGVGTDHRSDRPRLGPVHHNYRLAQVHEVGVTFLGGRSTCARLFSYAP